MPFSVESVVDEQVSVLSGVCDLDDEVKATFRVKLLDVLTAHLGSLTVGGGSGTKEKKQKLSAKSSKPKEDKLSTKNGYHFFVANKMPEVKAAGVESKSRMSEIGIKWKALDETGRLPFKNMASRYNEYVTGQMKTPDWKERREAVLAEANRLAGVSIADVPDTLSVVTTATAPASVVAPTPLVAPALVVTQPQVETTVASTKAPAKKRK
jgi:hypothetical protein